MPDRIIYLEDETQLAGDNVTDDTAALQAALFTASPGDVVKAKRGATYRLASVAPYPADGMPIPAGVHLDPNNATFAFEFTVPGVHGFRMLNNSRLWGEGKVKTAVSQNGYLQAIDHAPIGVGALYNAALSPFLTTRGWKIGGGLEIENVKPDGSGIQIFGEMDDYCLIEDLHAPDSSTIGLVIGADWTPLGSWSSADSAMQQNKTNWTNGTFRTLHPGNLIINRISTGKLTNTNYAREDGGPTVIRLSACHDVKVSNITSKQASALYRNVGGDYGFEFAKGIIRMRAGSKGNSAEKMLLLSHRGTNAAVQVDTVADNVLRAQQNYGYQPMFSPVLPTDLAVRDTTVIRDFIADPANPGTPQKAFYAHHTAGAAFIDCNSIGASIGVHVDSSATAIRLKAGYHYEYSVSAFQTNGSVVWV
jgi:hypothetical protein